MKNNYLIFCFILCGGWVFGQTTADIFSTAKTPITYIGLDFSRVQLVGPDGFTDPVAIQAEYFNKWNNLVLDEFDKYDLKKTFVKQTIDFDLGVVEVLNREVDAANLVINKSAKKLDQSDIANAVSRYNFKGITNAIAVAFIVESFDKVSELATFHVVFVNTQNNQIIFNEKVTGEPRGFGLRNYWAGALYHALQKIQRTEWRIWRKAAESK